MAGFELQLSYPVTPVLVVQAFGVHPENYSQFGLPGHEGIDFKAPHGTPVMACAPGSITRVERVPPPKPVSGWPYGIQVRVEHIASDGIFETIYAHFMSVEGGLKVGDIVTRGQLLGLADNTGNSFGDHLHLTLKKRGATVRGEKQQLGDGAWVVYPSDIVDPTHYFRP